MPSKSHRIVQRNDTERRRAVALKYRAVHELSAATRRKKGRTFRCGLACYFKLSELQEVSEVLDGADHLRNVGVLVVVPGNDLNLGLAVGQLVNHGLGSVEQRTEGHADDVGGDDLVLGVAVG